VAATKVATAPTKVATAATKVAMTPTKVATAPTKVATAATKVATAATMVATTATKVATAATTVVGYETLLGAEGAPREVPPRVWRTRSGDGLAHPAWTHLLLKDSHPKGGYQQGCAGGGGVGRPIRRGHAIPLRV
jgi:hypothetical protein